MVAKIGDLSRGMLVAALGCINWMAMLHSHQTVHAAFDRFQDLLLNMRVGDELRASEAAKLTGLSDHVCRSVLEGLKRAGLMTHQGDDRFVRKTLEALTTS